MIPIYLSLAFFLVIILLLDSIPRFGKMVSNFFLLFMFLFMMAQLDQSIGSFYTVMALGVMLFSIYELAVSDPDVRKVGSFKFSNLGVAVVSLLVGIVLFFFIRQLGGGTASVLGVPKVLVSVGTIKAWLSPAFLGALGFLENRFFFGATSIIKRFITPLFIPGKLADFTAYFFVALLFAIFHLSMLSAGFFLFAFIIFFIWQIIAFETPLGEEPTSVSHYLHNGVIGLSRTVVGG